MGRKQKPLAGATEIERFALRLRHLRARSGLTIRQLADKAGYAHSTLSKAEAGEQLPTWEVAEAFIQACGENPAAWHPLWLAAGRPAEPVPDPPRTPATPPAAAGGPASGPASSPSPEGADAPRSPAPRPWPRRWLPFAYVSAGTAAAVLLAVLLWPEEDVPSAPPRSSASARPAATTWKAVPELFPDPDRPGDGMDPIRAECASPPNTQQVLTLDEVPVMLPGGKEFGRLRLRHQPACEASWGVVIGPHGPKRAVHLAAYRPRDGISAPSSFSGESPDSYGNMLLTRPGCVYVEAYVVTAEGRGPTARTRCA